MAGWLAAEIPLVLKQAFDDIAVADIGPVETDAQFPECQLESEIGHERSDHIPAQRLLAQARPGDDVENVIPVDEPAVCIDEQDTVAIAVEGDAEIGLLLEDTGLQQFRVCGADAVIDIQTVWIGTDRNDLRTEFRKHLWRDVVGRAMGAVDDNLHPLETRRHRDTALAEFDVASGGIIDAARTADGLGLDGRHRLVELLLDRQLHLVGQFLAGSGEKLEAVVVVGIVGCADDDAGTRVEGLGQVGDAGGRHRPGQQHVHAGSLQTRLEC